MQCLIWGHSSVTYHLGCGGCQLSRKKRYEGVKPGVHTNDFAPIHGRRARIHTAPEEDNTSNQQSTPQALCEYGRADRESGRNR